MREERVKPPGYYDDMTTKASRAMQIIWDLYRGRHPERNPIKRLRLYEQHAHLLIDVILDQQQTTKVLNSMLLMETPNERQRWTDLEDELLVNSRAENEPMHIIAGALGRTPSACATRLSILTGIPRSEIVEAYIEGTLESEPVQGLFEGKIRKVAP